MDIETIADILTGSCTCLAKAKSPSIIPALICTILQVGKCWGKVKGILQLKVCNANIHTDISHLMDIKEKDN